MPAWATDVWAALVPYLEPFAVWRGYEQELQTLAIYGIGIAVYTALVFTFYQSLSKRRPVSFAASEDKGWTGRMSRFTERALVFPIVSFLYFAVLAVALFVLVKAGQSTEQLLMVAMAVVVGVRVLVYLSEGMANDLSKLLPLSLLGITLVDPDFLKLSVAWTRAGEAVSLWPLLARYFLLFIALEAVLSSVRWTLIKAQGGRVGAPENTYSVDVKVPKPPIRKAP